MSEKPAHPFQIAYAANPVEGGFDLMLQVGNLKDEETCKKLGKLLSEWLTEDGGWMARFQ